MFEDILFLVLHRSNRAQHLEVMIKTAHAVHCSTSHNRISESDAGDRPEHPRTPRRTKSTSAERQDQKQNTTEHFIKKKNKNTKRDSKNNNYIIPFSHESTLD